MNKTATRIFLLASFVSICGLGCSKGCSGSGHKIKASEQDMTKFQEDLVVPSELWTAIESVFKPMALDPEGRAAKEAVEAEKKEGGAGGVEKGPKGVSKEMGAKLMKKKPQLDPFAFTIELEEKTEGVLGGQNYALKFPVGGGILDLRYFIPGAVNGTFYFRFKTDSELDPKETRIYYLSNAKVRQVGSTQFGNGCDRYFDISEYWKKSMKGDGFVMNTVGNRHVSILSGTFFVVSPHKGKLRMTHLTVRDSRFRDLVCDPEK